MFRTIFTLITCSLMLACVDREPQVGGNAGDDGGGGKQDGTDGPMEPGGSGSGDVPYRGVNLAGAEFAEHELPGTYGSTYIYPTDEEVIHFVGKGMNTFRIPFLWERLQPVLNDGFDATELGRLDAVVTSITSRGAYALIDPHNYARYRDNVIGAGVSNAAFADFWHRLADHYKGSSRVIFGVMNEPNTMPTEQWIAAANAAIASIRATGATNLVLVPGNAWTGAHSWLQNWYGTANATAILDVVDPANNWAIEVHQYLDADASGRDGSCVDSTVGSQRMTAFTDWARANGRKAFLGEFAGGTSATCAAAIGDMVAHLHANSDVYIGWTWWAAGPWWGDYIFTLEPQGTTDRPQMQALAPYLRP